jgi:uncharacterized protein involved in exopolysaccharide biosynthesis
MLKVEEQGISGFLVLNGFWRTDRTGGVPHAGTDSPCKQEDRLAPEKTDRMTVPHRPAPAPTDDSVDPLDLLAVLGRRRRRLLLWPFAAAVLAAGISLVLPETFTGVTRVLTPQQAPGPSAALLNQLGGLAGVTGGALGVKSPNDLYLGLLRTEAVADGLIERFGLKEAYRARYQVDARKALAARTRLDSEKSGLIVIEVDAGNAALAADMANAYVEQLHKLTNTLAVTEAAQRRLFFERQLRQATEQLAGAEVELRRAIEAGGMVSVQAQVGGAVETMARLRAQISANEIKLGFLRSYASADNPDVRRSEQELASMHRELFRLESGAGEEEAPGPRGGGGKDARGMANLRLAREVKYREVMFELLAKQYELARAEESKEAPLVQVVDRARPPERRTRPKRTLMVLAAAGLALLAAVLATFAQDALATSALDPARQAKLAALRAAWRRGP